MLAIEEQNEEIAVQSSRPPPPPPPAAGAIASSSSSSSGPQVFNIADDDDLQLADGSVNPSKLAMMIRKKNDRIVQGTVITKRAPTPKTVQGKAIRKKADY